MKKVLYSRSLVLKNMLFVWVLYVPLVSCVAKVELKRSGELCAYVLYGPFEQSVLTYRTEELEKEVTIFKQMLNFKEEELIAINQQKEDLLTRYVGNHIVSFLLKHLIRM